CNESTIDNGIDVIESRYNDVGSERSFETSHGTTVTVKGGDYGTYIDIKTLRKDVKAAILENKAVNDVISFKRNTLDGETTGIGDTYVEIDLTNQYLYMYVDGVLVKDCPVVTGLPGSRATPQGVYRLKSKSRNVTLVGADYRTPVSYWMPFNRGIGMHDATWQSRFGGNVYKTRGSHGCINLAMKDVSEIYEYAKVNMPVICYYHDRIDAFKPISAYERNKA
ncbi:MAG: L,D-transpeptidase family protein, partial [Clostridia bacterium]|nr:L,D-transpeptidase family protein [Clostridia bacterium]